ncbi:MAG: mechanosensitive ion channel [Flavisolibacter sp.]|nr:mechanosensitive ion channel [Flavisolibacter sp.]
MHLHEKRHRLWLTTYVVISVLCLAFYFLLRFRVFDVLGTYRQLLQKLSLATFFIFVVLMITKGVELWIVKGAHGKAERYNLIRLIRLLSVVIAALVLISFLFKNWYTAAVSLGLISLLLGFALQTPISSLIGWFYIVIRVPYRVGDRIQINDFKGDVVEINYLDTTLWEFGGDYLSNDLPSGRLIRFPNTLVLESQVYNYSWKKFPYIWNEIPFHIAYESDLQYVETTIKRVATNELSEQMIEDIHRLKDIIAQTPIDEVEIKGYPFVAFRVNANTWIEVTLTYLVAPKKAAGVRSRLIKLIIAELLKEPDKVMFPKGSSR